MKRTIVLASTSTHRRAQLRAAGIEHEAVAPAFDETIEGRPDPEVIAIAFARGKTEAVARVRPDAIVIGADQVPEVEGAILRKPEDRAAAIEQLARLAGRTHRLLTAVAVHDPKTGVVADRLVVHTLRMRALSAAQIEAYVARDRPEGCAGGYKIEAAGALLFSAVEGPDPSAIVGLPMIALTELLVAIGADPL
jgi:septum formation protein